MPTPESAHVPTKVLRARARKARARQERLAAIGERVGLNATLLGWLLLLIISAGLTLVWLSNRPTPQDLLVRNFFRATQQGNYAVATGLLDGGTFQALAAQSTVHARPIPGGPLITLPLQSQIADEQQIADGLTDAPQHVTPIHFEALHTQRDHNRDRKLVQFRLSFDIEPGRAAALGRAPDEPAHFTLEGTATTVPVNGGWKLKGLDFMIIPQHLKDLRRLMGLFGGDVETVSVGGEETG